MAGRAGAEFSKPVKKELASRAGYLCSNPECRAPTSAAKKGSAKGAVNLGQAAHIRGAAPGSARYDTSMTDEQRCHIDNGIWLCSVCAKKIDDDEHHFKKELLREWRRDAEEHSHRVVGRPSAPLSSTGASVAAPPAAKPSEFPVLPLRATLRSGPEPRPPRELSLWVEPSPLLDLTVGEARAALAGCRGTVALKDALAPMEPGQDRVPGAPHHARFGAWRALWSVDDSDPSIVNLQEFLSVGISATGVLAWQHERAYLSRDDAISLQRLVQQVAAFLRCALAVFAELEASPDTTYRVHLALGTLRPSGLIVKGAPFFGPDTPREVGVKPAEERTRGRIALPLQSDLTVAQLTQKLINRFLASCRPSTLEFDSKPPAVVSIDLADVQRVVGGEASTASAAVEIELKHRTLSQTPDLHRHELVATIRNVGKRRIEDWEVELEFPAPMLEPGPLSGLVPARSDQRRALFRQGSHTGREPLRPGDESEVVIGYRIDNDIYRRRAELFSQTGVARASVDGVQVGEVQRVIADNLENF